VQPLNSIISGFSANVLLLFCCVSPNVFLRTNSETLNNSDGCIYIIYRCRLTVVHSTLKGQRAQACRSWHSRTVSMRLTTCTSMHARPAALTPAALGIVGLGVRPAQGLTAAPLMSKGPGTFFFFFLPCVIYPCDLSVVVPLAIKRMFPACSYAQCVFITSMSGSVSATATLSVRCLWRIIFISGSVLLTPSIGFIETNMTFVGLFVCLGPKSNT
jgi:hypothetical protein